MRSCHGSCLRVEPRQLRYAPPSLRGIGGAWSFHFLASSVSGVFAPLPVFALSSSPARFHQGANTRGTFQGALPRAALMRGLFW